MALTINDYRRLAKDPLTRGMVDIFLMRTKLAEYITRQKTSTMTVKNLREVSLPTPGTRDLGAYWASQSTGTTDYVEDTVWAFGGYFDTDYLLEKDTSVLKSPRQVNTEMWGKTMAYSFNDIVVNGAIGSTQPDGIVTRVGNLDSAQTLSASGINVSPSGFSATSGQQLLDKLDALLYQIDNGTDSGQDTLLLMNQDALLAIWSTLRRLGVLTITKNSFGVEVHQYKNAKLIDVGVKADQTTKIIPTTTNTTPIYAAKMGDDFFSMIEYLPLKIEDQGKIPGTKNLRTDIEWVFGFTMPHPRGLAQLTSLQVT